MGKRSCSVREIKIKHACNVKVKQRAHLSSSRIIANLERTQRKYHQMQYQNIMEAIINIVPTKAQKTPLRTEVAAGPGGVEEH